jgi:hypothetical protein
MTKDPHKCNKFERSILYLSCLISISEVTVHGEMLNKAQSHYSGNLIFADILDGSCVGGSRLTQT